MIKQSPIPTILSVAFVILSVVYFGLVLHYQSPRPLDLFEFVSNNSWTVDSALVQRLRPGGKRIPRNLDSLGYWYYTIDICGHNRVQQFFTIDSLVVLHQLNGSFLARALLHSFKLEPKKLFVISERLIGRRFVTEPESDTSSIAHAFHDHAMRLVLYTSRGIYQCDLQSYRTTSNRGMMVW
jgi:hypothetical protein